jgi:hypothetical protein
MFLCSFLFLFFYVRVRGRSALCAEVTIFQKYLIFRLEVLWLVLQHSIYTISCN